MSFNKLLMPKADGIVLHVSTKRSSACIAVIIEVAINDTLKGKTLSIFMTTLMIILYINLCDQNFNR